MPIYVYRREDGTEFEFEQRITDDALTHCPTTGQAVSRVISGGTGLIFKGSGFYLTDYARPNGSASTAPSEKKDAPATKEPKTDAATTTTAKKESK